MKILFSAFAMLLAFASASLHAENVQDRWDAMDENRWSGFLSADFSRNSYGDTTRESERSASLSAIVRYSLDRDTRLQAVIGRQATYRGDSYNSRGDGWTDTSLSISRNNLWKPFDKVSMSAEARIYFPTSEYSKDVKLETAIRAGARFSINLVDLIDGLYISDYVRLRKNFHQYKRGPNAETLDEYSLSNIFSADYYFADVWSFSASFIVRTRWNYNGDSHSPDVIHSEQFGYQINDNIDVSLGMTNGINYSDPEMADHPRFDLYDLNKVTYYLAANYKF